MPRIKFTQHPKVPRDMVDRGYERGWEGEVSNDEAQRWIRRGVAEIVTSRSSRPNLAEKEPEPNPVENIGSQTTSGTLTSGAVVSNVIVSSSSIGSSSTVSGGGSKK